ncbi:MAG: hypothetical protein IJ658_13770 [Kiritimatiellae bacterium]|nr:hypothetical protein [Kiritimatiellia bacterium]
MKKLLIIAPALILAGCFTIRQTEMPASQMTRAPEGRDIKVALSGFAATLTELVPVYGYETVYVERGWHGRRGPGPRRGWHGGHFEAAPAEAYLPQTRANETFRLRAQATLEENGFLLRATPADYAVDVTFAGPFVSSSEIAAEWAWMLCSVLTTEYSVQTWTAKLKIYDNKTGHVLFHEDYSQKYEDLAFSPLFFVGLSGYAENTFCYMQNWCLTALTDRAMAAATSFLARRNP